ncbi:Zinc/iron permease [Phycomyces blakesleeanus]
MIAQLASTDQSFIEAWLSVLVSSGACIVGASIVFVDNFWPASHPSVLNNPSFLSAALALASGVLLFSSLSTLLPASRAHLKNDFFVYASYFLGVCLTLTLTYVIQFIAPDAIHSCHGETDSKANEETGLNGSHSNTRTKSQKIKSGGTYGIMTTEIISQQQEREEEEEEEDEQKMAREYFTTGIQTATAIVVHKFPEGLIMFVSSQASPQLGLNVAIAVCIHNLIEGFMIALPLYLATQSRRSAFGYAALLGGLSQPIGALVGMMAIHGVNEEKEDCVFGIIFGVVSGMMSFIAVQSMLPQAIKLDTDHRFVAPFFFIGIFLIGLASLLKAASTPAAG